MNEFSTYMLLEYYTGREGIGHSIAACRVCGGFFIQHQRYKYAVCIECHPRSDKYKHASPEVKRMCIVCGKEFILSRKHRTICSDACKREMLRDRYYSRYYGETGINQLRLL